MRVLTPTRAVQLMWRAPQTATLMDMFGLYALKPWYARRLGGVRRVLSPLS